MNEIYLGDESDKRYIKTYLSNIRRLDPVEIATLWNPLNLADPSMGQRIDTGLFRKLVSCVIRKCKEKYAVEISRLKMKRVLVAEPPARDHGGFHSPHNLGYQYWYHGAFNVLLDTQLVSKRVRTIELARNFLHDCFHYSTFVSWRRVIRTPAENRIMAKRRVPEIYREQYGINFRNSEGVSYSSPDLTAQSPETINLNLLMDGVIVIVVAELLKECAHSPVAPMGNFEEGIWKEIFLEPFDPIMFPKASNFHAGVVVPSNLFTEYWGGGNFISLVLRAMISGELSDIRRFFEEETGEKNAWEKKFRRAEFELPMNPKCNP